MKDLFFKTLMIKGEPGGSIDHIEKTGTSGLIDTYTIYLNDGTTSTFEVENGNGIDHIEKTGTSGYTDTYTIYFENGDTTTFDVKNGEDAPSYEVPTDSVLYFDSSAAIPEGYEATSNPEASYIVAEGKTSDTFEAVAGSSGSVDILVSKTGYTPLGVVGIYGTGTSGITYSDFFLYSTSTVRVYWGNPTATTRDVTLTVRVLYIKN